MNNADLIFDGLCIVSGVIVVRAFVRWRFPTRATTHGSARYLTLWEAVRRRLFFPWPRGFLVGDWSRWAVLPVYFRGVSNMLLVGPPGSFKGAGALMTNALRLPFMFILDVGGEISAVSVKEWRRRGYDVQIINAWNLFADAPWKLAALAFNVIDMLVPGSPTFASYATWFSEMLVTRTGNEHENHFLDKAVAWLKALLMHLASFERPENRNLLTLRRYIMGGVDELLTLFDAMMVNPADELIARQGAECARMFETAPKEFSGIWSTMERATAFLEDEAVRDAVSRSDVRFKNLKGMDAKGRRLKGAIVAFVIPLQFAETHSGLVRLAIASAMLTMMEGKLARRRVLFVLDEFLSVGRMPRVVNGLAFFRRFRMQCLLVAQSIPQLVEKYGREWLLIESSCELRMYLAPRDIDTATHISRSIGTTTVETKTEQETARPLLTPEEIMQLPARRLIAFMGNLRPMLLGIRPYWERPSLRHRFNPNPYFARTPLPPATLPFEILLGALLRVMGWVLGPSLTFAAIAIAIGLWMAAPELVRPVVAEVTCVLETGHGCRR